MLNKHRKSESHILVKVLYLIAFVTFLNFVTNCITTYTNYKYYERDFNINISLNHHKIDINSAGAKELSTLSGIGKTTSKRIIQGRPYKNIGELYERGIIGIKTFNNIKNDITAGN